MSDFKPTIFDTWETSKENIIKDIDKAIIQPEISGFRAYYEDGKLFVKNGTEVKLDHLTQYLKLIPKGLILDGFLTSDKASIHQIMIKLLKGEVVHAGITNLVDFNILDVGGVPDGIVGRMNVADRLCKQFYSQFGIVKIKKVPFFKRVKSEDDLFKLLFAYEKTGGKGLIIRDPSCWYQNGKTNLSLILRSTRFAFGKIELINYSTKNRNKVVSVRVDIGDGVINARPRGFFTNNQLLAWLNKIKKANGDLKVTWQIESDSGVPIAFFDHERRD